MLRRVERKYLQLFWLKARSMLQDPRFWPEATEKCWSNSAWLWWCFFFEAEPSPDILQGNVKREAESALFAKTWNKLLVLQEKGKCSFMWQEMTLPCKTMVWMWLLKHTMCTWLLKKLLPHCVWSLCWQAVPVVASQWIQIHSPLSVLGAWFRLLDYFSQSIFLQIFSPKRFTETKINPSSWSRQSFLHSTSCMVKINLIYVMGVFTFFHLCKEFVYMDCTGPTVPLSFWGVGWKLCEGASYDAESCRVEASDSAPIATHFLCLLAPSDFVLIETRLCVMGVQWLTPGRDVSHYSCVLWDRPNSLSRSMHDFLHCGGRKHFLEFYSRF